jgi:hypothetical protein
MSKQILSVNPNLPIPPGTDANSAENPNFAIKSLMMTANQAQEDAKYDVPPKREGFQSPLFYLDSSYLSFILIALILFIVCKRQLLHGSVLLIVAIVLLFANLSLRRS